MKNNKVKILGMLVLGILLVGTISIAAEDLELIPDGIEFSFSSWFQHTFNVQDYSIVGDYRQCSKYPTKTLYFYPSDNEIVFMDIEGSDYCSSGYSLLDVFVNNWNPYKEYKNDLNSYCSSSYDQCIVEVYCCDHDECLDDRDCEDWYGSGSDCITKTANDENIDYKYSTFNYCTEPGEDEVKCYYDTGSGTCSGTRTYIGDTSCPETYMGYNLYELKSECLENEKGDVGDDGSTDNGDAGDGSGDIRLNGEIDFIYPSGGALMDNVVNFRIPIKNFGDKTETINIEAGFYSPNYAKDTAKLYSIFNLFSTVVQKPNCNPAEDFIKTKEVTLYPGESERIEISVIPSSALGTYNIGRTNLDTYPLIWIVGLYKECLGGYINEVGTTGKGVMFNYGTYEETSCKFNQNTNIFGGESFFSLPVDIFCGGERLGECEDSKTLILDSTCSITPTIEVIKGSVATATIINTISETKKISLSLEEISGATSQRLLASSCLFPSECILLAKDELDYNSNCISIDKLRYDGILTSQKVDDFFSTSKVIIDRGIVGGLLGGAGGIGLCIARAVPVAVLNPIVGATIGTACSALVISGTTVGATIGAWSGTFGSTDDELLTQLNAENANAIGICTKESKGNLDEFFGWASWFDIDGSGNKDGTDGLIIVIILGALGVVLLRR